LGCLPRFLTFVFPFFSNEGKQFLFRMDASGNLSLLAVSLPFRAAVSFQMGQNSRQMALWAFRSSEGWQSFDTLTGI
jgi:hypothetical protein